MDILSQTNLLIALLSYLAGSIPFGLVLTKMTGAGNLREIGSGNIGATNVLRTGRRGLAAATLVLDAAKGGATVLIANTISLEATLIAGLFAVIGHNFPIWIRFKGGKGVATTLGVLIAIDWQVGLLAIATWLLTAAISRYSSMAALLALLISPLYAWLVAGDKVAILVVLLAILGVARHRENILRLLAGKESKIQISKKDAG